MAISKREIFKKVKAALDAFFQEESSLLHVNASERSISHKLAEHLQRQFPRLNVDCEYNRHGNEIKRLNLKQPNLANINDLEARTVFPDIVVHKRRNDKNNILVIEIKKSNSGRNHYYDMGKLEAFTGTEYRYRLGLFLLFDVQKKCLSNAKCFSNGIQMRSTNCADLLEIGDGE